MPTPRLTDEQCEEALRMVEQHGSITAAADAEGINRATLRSSTVWLQLNVNRGSSGIELTRRQVAELRRALFEAQYGEIPRP